MTGECMIVCLSGSMSHLFVCLASTLHRSPDVLHTFRMSTYHMRFKDRIVLTEMPVLAPALGN